MKAFADLIKQLDGTNKTNAKIMAIEDFLGVAEEKDKLWFLALFTGRRPKRLVPTNLMKQWAMQEAAIPEWLFLESYLAVGDLGETIALLLPDATDTVSFSLSEWMERISLWRDKTDDEKRDFVLYAWRHLAVTERFIFNKLIGGSFRIGVSSKTLINALAQYYQRDASSIAHAVMGDWQVDEVGFEDLILGRYADTHLSRPYPFCLAYPLDKPVIDLGNIDDWQVEYKWDGIRGQLIRRKGEVFIWSRGEELVNAQFPELVAALETMDREFVLDGEILVYKNQQVMDFSLLQKRLNRKSISKKLKEELPVVVFAYDLLELEGEDLRARTMQERRALLQEVLINTAVERIVLSPILTLTNWESLTELRANARDVNSEGVMLKNKRSTYHVGRKKGDWWKWKVQPMTIDAVLIYAQKGSGRRSGYYTDYTFAVRDADRLVTIAKAYSGLTDKEIQEVSKFVHKNAVEKFGPVRTVKAELVFEIAFEGINLSNRHKSGVALRFPRIVRWRKDKTVDDIDTIETVKSLIDTPRPRG